MRYLVTLSRFVALLAVAMLPVPASAHDGVDTSSAGLSLWTLTSSPQLEPLPGLMLAVCPLRLDFDNRIPRECTGLAPAAARVEVPTTFDFTTALREERLARFLHIANGGVAGVRWSGQLRVDRAGEHAFQVDVSLAEGRGDRVELVCPVRLRIAGQQVAAALGEFETWTGGALAVDQGRAQLEPGLYAFEVFVACHAAIHFNTVVRNTDMRRALERVRVGVSFAEPGDKALLQLPPGRLSVAR